MEFYKCLCNPCTPRPLVGVLSNCGHAFCYKCLMKWVEAYKVCPYCMQPIIAVFVKDDPKGPILEKILVKGGQIEHLSENDLRVVGDAVDEKLPEVKRKWDKFIEEGYIDYNFEMREIAGVHYITLEYSEIFDGLDDLLKFTTYFYCYPKVNRVLYDLIYYLIYRLSCLSIQTATSDGEIRDHLVNYPRAVPYVRNAPFCLKAGLSKIQALLHPTLEIDKYFYAALTCLRLKMGACEKRMEHIQSLINS